MKIIMLPCLLIALTQVTWANDYEDTLTVPTTHREWNIENYCNKAKPSNGRPGKTVQECIEIETENADWNSKGGVPLRIFGYCRQTAIGAGGSYTALRRCVADEINRTALASSATRPPAFDTKGYCQSVSDAVGGSYQIELTCREQEERALNEITRMNVPERIMSYCTEVSASIGGSYSILQTCIEQEIEAFNKLN